MTNNSRSYVGGGGKKFLFRFFCFSSMLAIRPKTIAVLNYAPVWQNTFCSYLICFEIICHLLPLLAIASDEDDILYVALVKPMIQCLSL